LATALSDNDIVIFKGGETWTGVYPWSLQHGTSAMVTYTVDQAWYTGGSWTQPVFDDQGAHPGGTGMINTTSGSGWFTFNNVKFFACGELGEGVSQDKCLVFPSGHDLAITFCTFVTYAWIDVYMAMSVPGSYSNIIMTDNDVSHTSSMFWIASTTSNVSIHNVQLLRNVGHDISSQLGGVPGSLVDGHHANMFIHYFSSGGHNDPTQYIDGLRICDNRTYGDFRNQVDNSGIANTAIIFFEGSASGVVCNNVFTFDQLEAGMFNSLIIFGHYENAHAATIEIYNNTIVQPVGVNSMSQGIGISSCICTISIKNNIIANMQYTMSIQGSAFTLDSNYNLMFGINGQNRYNGTFQTYAVWQAAGRDTNSVMGVNPSFAELTTNLRPAFGSPAINAGVDLTSLGYSYLLNDVLGVARGGTWDIGAYEYGEPPVPPAMSDIYIPNFKGATWAVLLWTPSSDASVTSYSVYRCASSGACGNRIANITPASSAAARTPLGQFLDSKLYTAGTYYYTVTADSLIGTAGTASSEVSVTVTGKQ
jgi:hypothetical protein